MRHCNTLHFLSFNFHAYGFVMAIRTNNCDLDTATARFHPVHLMNASSAPGGADSQTKPTDFGCESTCRLLPSTSTVAVYYHYSGRIFINFNGAHSSCCPCRWRRYCSVFVNHNFLGFSPHSIIRRYDKIYLGAPKNLASLIRRVEPKKTGVMKKTKKPRCSEETVQ